MDKLKTLAEHEAERAKSPHAGKPGYPSGVRCPDCGAELLRAIGGAEMLDHYGGRKPVFCPRCPHESTVA